MSSIIVAVILLAGIAIFILLLSANERKKLSQWDAPLRKLKFK